MGHNISQVAPSDRADIQRRFAVEVFKARKAGAAWDALAKKYRTNKSKLRAMVEKIEKEQQ